MRSSDLSVQVSHRKPACVLDPALILGHAAGPDLALQLVQVFEPWLTRSFWQTIDASELLLRRYENLAPTSAAKEAFIPDAQALVQWIRLRDQTDAGHWELHWIEDNYAQSQLHDDAEFELVDRYESLAETLAARVAPQSLRWPSMDPVLGAVDALALSACLGGAVILTGLGADEGAGREPPPVEGLRRAGLDVRRVIDPSEPDAGPLGLFAVERRWMREALVRSGLVALLQELPPLGVVHVRVPQGGDSARAPAEEEALAVDAWGEARAWWYAI